jgi:hypothetical protein
MNTCPNAPFPNPLTTLKSVIDFCTVRRFSIFWFSSEYP